MGVYHPELCVHDAAAEHARHVDAAQQHVAGVKLAPYYALAVWLLRVLRTFASAWLSSSGMLLVGWLWMMRSLTPLPAAADSASNTSCPSCPPRPVLAYRLMVVMLRACALPASPPVSVQ